MPNVNAAKKTPKRDGCFQFDVELPTIDSIFILIFLGSLFHMGRINQGRGYFKYFFDFFSGLELT